MAKLTKTINYTYTAAQPGTPGFAGTPYSPSYSATACTTQPPVCLASYSPIYGQCAPGSLVLGSTCVVNYIWSISCSGPRLICSTVNYPGTAATPSIPATPPTPAQLSVILNENWNSSAQSIDSLMPGQGLLFKVGVVSRSVLVGATTESWLPRISTLPWGMLFTGADGVVKVFENNVAGASLGNFWSNQEFVIGRTINNRMYYWNYTDGQRVMYTISDPAPVPATTPLYVFALEYRGGDVVIT